MITYGNGEVIGLENIQGFDIKYKGSIEIDPAQDNWIIQANKNRIIGICLNTTSSALLFTYTGELRILSAKYIRNNEQYRSRITLQGVDYWELDREKWEDDGSLWGTRNGTYLVGSKKRKTTVKNLENGVSKVPVHDMPSQSLPNHIVLSPPLINTYSLDFDGSDDYVVADMPSAFSGITLNNFNCTMSAWAKFDTIGIYEAIVCMGTFDLEIAPVTATEVGIWINNLKYSGAVYAPTMGEWNHYAMTKSGNNYSLYIDGSLYGTGTDSDNATVGDEFFIGRNGHTHYFDGNIDEVAIWDVALDADAITAIYNSGTPTNLSSDSGNYDNSSNLQGYWRMGDGDTYPTITDNSSNSNDGTMTNMVSGDIEEDTP